MSMFTRIKWINKRSFISSLLINLVDILRFVCISIVIIVSCYVVSGYNSLFEFYEYQLENIIRVVLIALPATLFLSKDVPREIHALSGEVVKIMGVVILSLTVLILIRNFG